MANVFDSAPGLGKEANLVQWFVLIVLIILIQKA